MTGSLMVKLEADTSPLENSLKSMQKLADSFGTQLTTALKGAVLAGKELDDVFRQLALNLASMALNQALKPLQGMFSSAMSSIMGGIMPFAKGGVPGSITPFAAGGIVAQPTFFGTGSGLGVMGEAGAEAILPLQRASDGRLGVASAGRGTAVHVNFNVQATDVTSFRKSEAQLTTMLARAVGRGTRYL